MLEMVKSLILDFQEGKVETGVPRRLNDTPVDGKASVFVGVRRSGKSTLLMQRIRHLVEEGTPRENILFLNFFDDRLHPLRKGGLDVVHDAYFSLYPGKKGAERVHFFFDEIQETAGWEPFVERLLRTENCTVTLTGSSARLLSREIATQMRGRALSWEVFPFSFREYLDFRGIAADIPMSTKRKMEVRNAFQGFWETGGFPEVASVEPSLRIRIHQEYFKAMLMRDVVDRWDFSHPRAVEDLGHWAADNAASSYTVNRLAGLLKSMGHKVPKSSVSEILEWFEDAYFFYTVRLFDPSFSRSNANPKKIYAVDHSLLNSVSSGILGNGGHLLENLVFTALRRTGGTPFYYRTRSNREVDFVLPGKGGMPLLVQVCESMAAVSTRERELAALAEAMKETGAGTGIVVTRDEEAEIEDGKGRVRVLPAWRFLLEMDQGGI